MLTVSISQAPKDGRVCLIGIEYDEPKPTLVYELEVVSKKLWASFDWNINKWREIGYNGIIINTECIKWYYPYPYGEA